MKTHAKISVVAALVLGLGATLALLGASAEVSGRTLALATYLMAWACYERLGER